MKYAHLAAHFRTMCSGSACLPHAQSLSAHPSPCLSSLDRRTLNLLQAERKKRQNEAELQTYQHDWKQHVLRLKEYFDSQGLKNVDPLGMQPYVHLEHHLSMSIALSAVQVTCTHHHHM